jgi:formate-dependent phosphoribosylglycinamide formyltransferase (GAR transformylase)
LARDSLKRMNATTISIDTSHYSYVAHPDEIAQLILDAAAAQPQAQPQGNNPG